MEGVLRPTLNLGNSIIGVGLLAMPYCIKECGIILGLLLLVLSGMFSTWSLKMLVKSAHMARKASYEQLAFHAFGRYGKLLTEISIIGLTLGCLVGFFVVIGDLAPPIVAQSLGLDWSLAYLRMLLMIFLALTVSLPLSLLRKVDSLSAVAVCSLLFYSCLLLVMVYLSLTNLFTIEVWKTVLLWRWEGVMQCLSIFALGLTCQPQMFVIYTQMADPSVRKMSTVINGAVWMVATGYGIISFFGYITFCLDGVKGDILSNFPHDSISQFLRFAFSLSVVVSFPLVIFPVRTSIYSLLFSKTSSMELHSSEPIPAQKFNLITVVIVLSTLTIAILVPQVETVLALTGATMGSLVCFIIPSLIFLSVVGSHTALGNRAKFLLVLGIVISVLGTSVVIRNHINMDTQSNGIKTFRPIGEPLVLGPEIPAVVEPPNLENIPGPPGGNDARINEVHIPAAAALLHGEEVEGGKEGVEGVREGVRGRGGEVGDTQERGGDMQEGAGGTRRRESDGEGDGVRVEGAGEVGMVAAKDDSLQEQHELIKQDMEELKERMKAVEEENKELKDALGKRQGEGGPPDGGPLMRQPAAEVTGDQPMVGGQERREGADRLVQEPLVRGVEEKRVVPAEEGPDGGARKREVEVPEQAEEGLDGGLQKEGFEIGVADPGGRGGEEAVVKEGKEEEKEEEVKQGEEGGQVGRQEDGGGVRGEGALVTEGGEDVRKVDGGGVRGEGAPVMEGGEDVRKARELKEVTESVTAANTSKSGGS